MKIYNKGPEFLANQRLRPLRSSYPANAQFRRQKIRKRLFLTIALGIAYIIFVYTLLKVGNII